jgi:hypothetical protein
LPLYARASYYYYAEVGSLFVGKEIENSKFNLKSDVCFFVGKWDDEDEDEDAA